MSSAMAGERLVAGLADNSLNRKANLTRVGASVQHLLNSPGAEEAIVMRVAQPVRYHQPAASMPVSKGSHLNKGSRASGVSRDIGTRAGRTRSAAPNNDDAMRRPYVANGDRRGVRRVTSAPASGHHSLAGRAVNARPVREEVLRRPDAGLQVNGFSSSNNRRPVSADQPAAHPVYRLTGGSAANSVAANLKQRAAAADSAAAVAAARSVRSAGGLLGARAQHRMGAGQHQAARTREAVAAAEEEAAAIANANPRGPLLSAWAASQQDQQAQFRPAAEYNNASIMAAFRARSTPGTRGGMPYNSSSAPHQQQPKPQQQQRLAAEPHVHGGSAFASMQQARQDAYGAFSEEHVHGGTAFGANQPIQIQRRYTAPEVIRPHTAPEDSRPRAGIYGARSQQQHELLMLADRMLSQQSGGDGGAAEQPAPRSPTRQRQQQRAAFSQQPPPQEQPQSPPRSPTKVASSPQAASGPAFSPARGVGARGVSALLHSSANPLEPPRLGPPQPQVAATSQPQATPPGASSRSPRTGTSSSASAPPATTSARPGSPGAQKSSSAPPSSSTKTTIMTAKAQKPSPPATAPASSPRPSHSSTMVAHHQKAGSSYATALNSERMHPPERMSAWAQNSEGLAKPANHSTRAGSGSTSPAGVRAAASAAAAEALAIAREETRSLKVPETVPACKGRLSSPKASASQSRRPNAARGSKAAKQASAEAASPPASRTAQELMVECLGLAGDLGMSMDGLLMSFLEVEDEVREIMAINGRESLT